jgi:hypothetical protein
MIIMPVNIIKIIHYLGNNQDLKHQKSDEDETERDKRSRPLTSKGKPMFIRSKNNTDSTQNAQINKIKKTKGDDKADRPVTLHENSRNQINGRMRYKIQLNFI